MARKRRRRKKGKQSERIKQTIIFEVIGLILLAVSIIALVQAGYIGTMFRAIFRFFAGSWDFLIPLFMIGLSFYIMWKREWPTKWSLRSVGVLLICCSILILTHLSLVEAITDQGRFADQSIIASTWSLYVDDLDPSSPVMDLGGGMVGALLYSMLNVLFDPFGTRLIVFFMVLIGVLMITGKSYKDIIVAVNNRFQRMGKWVKDKSNHYKQLMVEEHNKKIKENKKEAHSPDPIESGAEEITHRQKENAQESPPPVIHDFTDVAYSEGEVDPIDLDAEYDYDPAHSISTDGEVVTSDDVITGGVEQDYQLPPFSLLKKQARTKQAEKEDIATNAEKLEGTLASFGVQAKVTQVHRGPAVTRYEVYPDVGVKVSRIVNLTDDIALALAAKGIRIEAPIPGKSAIGIEVPNESVSKVTLREVLESSVFHESDSKLSVVLGRDISGEPIVAHLNRMPHLLVAGATGSGKSVCINGMICSILYKAKPHEVKFMMIDPKMVELNVYNGIPHLLAPVVTEPKKAAMSLKKVVAEMERRYELFAHNGTRDIERYNEFIQNENNRSEEQKPLLPYIVVIIDELADLMMVAPGDVEDAICRLAQMARAAGIHLIIATQRPSVDVITGLIKANIPSRIAFGVSSQTDSRTILDSGGAEKLLGRGDMLFLPVGASKPFRIQGAFLSEDEVAGIVHHSIEQQKAQYHDDMIPEELDNASTTQVQDDLYHQAVELVIHHGSASVSMLQRRFRIGYTRAARLIDSMEENGIVGPYEGSKPREVLVTKEESHISS